MKLTNTLDLTYRRAFSQVDEKCYSSETVCRDKNVTYNISLFIQNQHSQLYIYIHIYIYIYIYTPVFKKGFHIERYIDRYILLFSCTCARVHFSLLIVQLVKKLGSTINSLFVRFFVPICQ